MARTVKEMKAMMSDAQQCFGKLYDKGAEECQKCADVTDCQAWQTAGKDPATVKKSEAAKPPVTKDTKKTAAKAVEEPTEGKKAKSSKPAKAVSTGKARDENGYVDGSSNSRIFKLLLAGKSTKAEIEAELDLVGKSTVGVFIADLQRPVGVYSVSRGLKVLKSDKGVLSLESNKSKK